MQRIIFSFFGMNLGAMLFAFIPVVFAILLDRAIGNETATNVITFVTMILAIAMYVVGIIGALKIANAVELQRAKSATANLPSPEQPSDKAPEMFERIQVSPIRGLFTMAGGFGSAILVAIATLSTGLAIQDWINPDPQSPRAMGVWEVPVLAVGILAGFLLGTTIVSELFDRWKNRTS